MFEPAEYIRYATKWLKEHEIYQTHKKPWKTVLSMHPLKKWKIMKHFLKNYVFSAWGYPAAIFQAAVYTHTECIRRNLAGLEGIRSNLSVYGWLWGYPAEIMSVSGCRLNSGPKKRFRWIPWRVSGECLELSVYGWNWVYPAKKCCKTKGIWCSRGEGIRRKIERKQSALSTSRRLHSKRKARVYIYI